MNGELAANLHAIPKLGRQLISQFFREEGRLFFVADPINMPSDRDLAGGCGRVRNRMVGPQAEPPQDRADQSETGRYLSVFEGNEVADRPDSQRGQNVDRLLPFAPHPIGRGNRQCCRERERSKKDGGLLRGNVTSLASGEHTREEPTPITNLGFLHTRGLRRGSVDIWARDST